ncbi:uncharacterized protein (DUF1810 family) [Williamsia limnetica]|uniref:Uncharacterized protein (DUF1810 family) n=1 Tax=Williamsia limnetica TaxID=882452 RepID=A0A318RUC3_WILLI|nr:DUF1810 domain-containing protein [Williamsia limnetica]PYE20009.1 uncharacterized protein (DUF1810 family) [Williamsia limnetica]
MASDLKRFHDAQAAVYDDVTAELRAGRKRSHWMWFVFPQLDGLAHSGTAKRYAITGIDEARDYLADDVLGARLRECARLVLDIEGSSIEEIFGYPDNLKLRSSMTLFAAVAADGGVFDAVLHKFFGGEGDARTLELLG